MRITCYQCRKPKVVCYCDSLTSIDTTARFVIISHPKEDKRKTSTGRMAHLSLPNSLYVPTFDIDQSHLLTEALVNEDFFSVLLFPSKTAIKLPSKNLEAANTTSKPLQIFVIDSTWSQANTLLAASRLMLKIPRISFSTDRNSQFKFRSQPKPHCLSTMEAIDELLALLAEGSATQREGFLDPFLKMVDQQIGYQILNHPKHPRKWETPN